MYVNTLLDCHFWIQIITDHFLLNKVSHPIHTMPGTNAHLLYPILCPWKYSIRHKLLYCLVCILVVSMATKVVKHLVIISILEGSTGSGYN